MMEAVQQLAPPRRPLILHFPRIGAGAALVGVAAMMDGAIVAAFIAGGFTLVNTGLTVWLTGRKDSGGKRKRKDEDE